MKKIKINISLLMCLVAVFALTFTSCQKDEPMTPVLSAFGPLPVVRGDSLNFMGQNLNLVNELILPDSIVITKDKFIAPTATSFTIIVPQETMVGKVRLNYTGGTVVSKAAIKFEEPIEFADITTPAEAVRAGDVITISGDYLANIVSVVFADNVVSDTTLFTVRERAEIQLPVPREAISGLIYLVDAEGEQYYSETPLTVTQPEVTSFGPDTIKAGEVLTITGTNLDLVQKITFAGGSSVENADFATQTATSITLESPANLADGVVTYVSFASVSAATADTLITKLPTVSGVAAATVFKSGLNVVISGTDLDLVSAVQFTSGADIAAADLFADGKITVAIPENATNGAITLKTLSGKSVASSDITLVIPTTLATDKAEYMTEDDIVITGADLDLVKSVTLNGVEEVSAFANDKLTVTTTKSSKSGKLVLVLKNGAEVTVVENLTVTLKAEVKVSSVTPSEAQVGDTITMVGTGFNKAESIFIGETKVLNYVSRSDSQVSFTIPAGTAEGEHEIAFMLTSGIKETLPQKMTIVGAVKKVVVWTGSKDLGGWGNFEDICWGKTPQALKDEVKAGATFVIKGNASAGAQLKIMDPNGWSVIEDVKSLPTFDAQWGVVNIAAGAAAEVRFEVSEATATFLKARGLVMGGKLIVVEEIYLEIPAE